MPETIAAPRRMGGAEARVEARLMPTAESPGHFWPSVMNLEEAALFLRTTPQTLLKLARAGTVPGARVGQAWRFSRDALYDMLADSTEKPPLAGKSRTGPRRPPAAGRAKNPVPTADTFPAAAETAAAATAAMPVGT